MTSIIEILLYQENLWLTQAKMAELFEVQKAAISKHLKNIFESGELLEEAVVSKMETTALDGKQYNTNYYNLDAIIAVGYRVNSRKATRNGMGVEYSHAISLMPGHLQFPLFGHTVGKIKINKCLVRNSGGEGLGFKIFNYITVEINCNLLLFPFYIRVSFCIAKIIFVSHIVTSLIIIILTHWFNVKRRGNIKIY